MHRGRISTALRCPTCDAGPGQPCTFVGGAVLGLALFTLCVSCGGGLPPEDAQNLENAARTSAAAYRYVDGGPGGILIKATHCSVQAIVRDEQLPPFDSGIPCP